MDLAVGQHACSSVEVVTGEARRDPCVGEGGRHRGVVAATPPAPGGDRAREVREAGRVLEALAPHSDLAERELPRRWAHTVLQSEGPREQGAAPQGGEVRVVTRKNCSPARKLRYCC